MRMMPFQAIFVTPHGNWALVWFDEKGYSEDGWEYASMAEAVASANKEMPMLMGKYDKEKSELSLFVGGEMPLIIINEFFA